MAISRIKYTYLLAVLFTYIACSSGPDEDIRNELERIDDWTLIEFKKIKTDTFKVLNWLPDPEISATLRFKNDSSCLRPMLNFYPISWKNYMGKKLMTYLFYRAELFPPQPNVYTSDKYYLLIWHFKDYDVYKCCHCDQLETEIITRLNLTTEWTSTHPFRIPSK